MARVKKKKQKKGSNNAKQEQSSVLGKKWLGRIMLLVIVAAGGITLLQWEGAALSGKHYFPLNAVEVEGSFQHVDAAEVKEIVAPFVSKGFFAVDVRQVKQRLQEMPWVREANVRRLWPDKLSITIFEQQALARWNGEALVSVDGALFFPDEDEVPVALPQLYGPASSQLTVLNRFHAVNKELAALDLRAIRMVLDDRRAWRLMLENGVHLMLGRKENSQRLQRFIKIYPGVLASRIVTIREVDLRYTNGFVVRWKSPQGFLNESRFG